MDLQICFACYSLVPTAMSIRLKTCQHSFCVQCLKYAMMDQGSTDLQCPYPEGTYECGSSLTEDEVQIILDFEEEDFSGGSYDTTIEELEKSLDRVLTIDADEFPGVPEEELPNVRCLDTSEGSIESETPEEIPILSEIPESSDEEIPFEIAGDLDLIPFEKESIEVEEPSRNDFLLGTNYVDPSLMAESPSSVLDILDESSNSAKDVSKGAIPKVRSSANQESASDNETQQNSFIDQDFALALKIQEEESKINLDTLLAISDVNLPPNLYPFECPVCYGQFEPYEGITLKFCFHSFCKPCLSESVKHSEELEVTCPALVDGNTKCSAIIQDGAIRDLLTEEDFGRFQDRCLQTAEAVIPNTVHCLTPNCRGWVELIGEVISFDCLICNVTNCVSCKALHGNQSCEDYQANIQRKDDEIKSEATLRTLVETREGMRCPKCGVMITKIAGCDFMTCTTCKTGICWPTRGPRWGPGGPGDISGGCRCKVGGMRCHPDCEGCH